MSVSLADPTLAQQAVVFLIVGAFGLWGALAHALYHWDLHMHVSWPRITGMLMSGIFASWVTALLCWEQLITTRPALLLAFAGLGGWGGAGVINRFVDRWLSRAEVEMK